MLTRKGDEVYFNARGQATVGKVLCVGRHGVTVAADGKHHKIKHDQVLGHKAKPISRATVLDEGLDGALIQDEDGKRRFVSGYRSQEPEQKTQESPNPWRDMAPGMVMAKSMIEPMVEHLRAVHADLMTKAETQPMDVQPPVDMSPLFALLAERDALLKVALERLDSITSMVAGLSEKIAVIATKSSESDEFKALASAFMDFANRPLPPIDMSMTLEIPAKPAVAMKGTRQPDGSILMQPVEVNDAG